MRRIRANVVLRARTHKSGLPSPACSMSFPSVRHRTHFIRGALPMRWTVRVAWGIGEAVEGRLDRRTIIVGADEHGERLI